MTKVYVSPSDQTENLYAYGGTNEAVQCRKIGTALAAALKRCGFDSKCNVSAGMRDRVAESNKWGANLHVCVHTNAFNGRTTGTRLMCYAKASEGYKVCQAVMAALAPVTDTTGNLANYISVRPELYECNSTNAPCCYIEVDFHDVPTVAKWITENIETIAEAIAKGVCNHYGVSYKAPAQAQSGDVRYWKMKDVKSKTYRKTLEKLIEKKLLLGKGGEGDERIIDLSEDTVRTLVILDRAGAFGE